MAELQDVEVVSATQDDENEINTIVLQLTPEQAAVFNLGDLDIVLSATNDKEPEDSDRAEPADDNIVFNVLAGPYEDVRYELEAIAAEEAAALAEAEETGNQPEPDEEEDDSNVYSLDIEVKESETGLQLIVTMSNDDLVAFTNGACIVIINDCEPTADIGGAAELLAELYYSDTEEFEPITV